MIKMTNTARNNFPMESRFRIKSSILFLSNFIETKMVTADFTGKSTKKISLVQSGMRYPNKKRQASPRDNARKLARCDIQFVGVRQKSLSEKILDSDTFTTFPYFSRALVSKSLGFPTMAITMGFPLMFRCSSLQYPRI